MLKVVHFSENLPILKRKPKIITSIFVVLALLFFAGLFLNSFVEKKAISLLEEQVPELKFEKLKVQVFKNAAELTKIDLTQGEVNIQSERLKVSGLNYWKFLTQKNIDLNKIEINDPEVVYQTKTKDQKAGRKQKKDKQNEPKSSGLDKKITVEEIILNHSKFVLLDSVSDEKIKVKSFDFRLEGLKVDSVSISEKIPFQFDHFKLNADSVYFKVDDRHKMNVAAIEIQDKKSSLKGLKLESIYSKQEFQRHISVEKDRYHLVVDSIALVNQNFGFQNDSLRFKATNFLISDADFEIYRDKMQPDDNSIKPMYSEMLRKLPFLLKIDTLQVKNTQIVYEERMKANREPGKVVFGKVAGKISNLTNFSDASEFPTTRVVASANFMNQASLRLNWAFKVNNLSDWFDISGNMSSLSAENMNGFLRPAMNVQAAGSITNMDFDFSGNRNKATGGVNIAYKDFKIEVLKKDGTEKSGFLTTIANIFVKHNGESGRNVNDGLEIERDKTKSFWNYLWSCIKKGALKTFV